MVGDLIKRAYDRIFPYIPVIYLGFAYLAGGIGQSLVVGEARYAMLGVVTLPVAAALVAAFIRIRREVKSRDAEKQGDKDYVISGRGA